MSDTEFTNLEELERLSDKELETLVIQGTNLHIHTSKASIAKRILDNRRQIKQSTDINSIQVFLKAHWFPNQSLWFKIIAFLVSTVLVGIGLNLIADAIAKFILHW